MSRRDDQLPVHTVDLLRMLDKAIPPRCLLPNEDVHTHLRYAGQRDLIESLITRWEQENEGKV